MKLTLLITIIFVCRLSGWAQDKELVKFNTTNNSNEEFTTSIVKYPQFIKGKALFTKGSEVQALFNYNYNTNEILFISPKNDTMTLDPPALYRSIVIGADTFCYSKYGFMQQIKSGVSCRLFLKRNLEHVGSEKKAAYGGYSGTSASTPLRSFSDGATTHTVSTDENILYRFNDSYFFSDRFNNFFPATKKGIRELAWKRQNEMKDFVEENKIDFSKKEDLEKLLEFIQSIAPN